MLADVEIELASQMWRADTLVLDGMGAEDGFDG